MAPEVQTSPGSAASSMAGVVDKIRKKNRQQNDSRDWTHTGSFINKPARGWLHPDEQLSAEAGVCYGVRYIGCMEVTTSMKSLDFDTRTAVAKESISRVCEAAGLKTATKKKRGDKKLNRLLGVSPNMQYAGSNVNLTITIDSLNMVIMESGEIIANHLMPGISFASGGDADTMDFVAYVAKDSVNGRACHVLECGGGLAQDVITTVGQAFELRFKQFLANQPQAVSMPDRTDNFNLSGDAWGDDADYYNDRPGARAPSPPMGNPPEYAAPKCNLPISDGFYSSVKHKEGLYDNRGGDLINLHGGENPYDNTKEQGAAGGAAGAGAEGIYDNSKGQGLFYDNPNNFELEQFESRFDDTIYDNKSGVTAAASQGVTNGAPEQLDAFDMRPFANTLPGTNMTATGVGSANGKAPFHEEWFHGQISRVQTETLLLQDGDFLVRESANTSGQYVLSGKHNGRVKHLLLVDPEGVVRTRDRTFESISHLVNFHRESGLPISSQDSQVVLKRPIISSES